MTDQSQPGTNVPRALGILLVVCVSLFFSVLNASAVAVVLPDIAEDLSVDTGQLSWLMTGFLLVYGIAIPFYGRLADRYGVRRLFLIGVSVFALGSLVSALAPSYPLLLAARIVQAGGGAAVPGLGMTLATRAYRPEARGAVMGVIVATIGIAGGVGPLIGGGLSEAFGWQSIFLLNVAAAVAVPVGLKILPGNEDRSREAIDLIGGVALALMVVGVFLVPSEAARSGWSSPLVLAGGAAAVIGLSLLTARQLTAGSPFVPREFLRSFRYVSILGMSFSIMAAYSAPLIGLPLLLTISHGLSALEVGLVMLPGAILSSVSGVLAGRLTDGRGARLPAWIGSPHHDCRVTWAFSLRGVLGLDHWHFHGGTGGRVRADEYASERGGISYRPRTDARVGAEYQFDGLLHRRRLRHRRPDGNRDVQAGARRELSQSTALGGRGRLQRCVPVFGLARYRGNGPFAEAPGCRYAACCRASRARRARALGEPQLGGQLFGALDA